jgi:hypothetical protein
VSHPDTDTIALIALGESVDPMETEHIGNCPKCQSELDELHSVVSTARSITDADRPVAPPESVWAAIDGALVKPAPAKRNASWFALAASVGVVIGGLATFVAMQTANQITAPTLIAQASLEPLRDIEQPAQAVVQQVDGKNVLVVQASGLPATDGFYEVWLLAPDAQSMVSVGMLDSSEGGTFPLPAGIDLNQFPVVDVSHEHFDGDATHSTDSVLRGKLEI